MRLHQPGLRALSSLLLLASVACSTAKEEDTAPVVTVDVAPVLSAGIQETIRAQGVLYPLQQAAIVPRISAPIAHIFVERGARVRAGQLLMELENKDLAGAAQESEAAYQAAQATYETTSRATLPQEVQKAELDVEAARTAMAAQQAVVESRRQLVREGALAQKDLNDAEVAFTQAKNQYAIAQRGLDDLRGFARDQALKAAAAERDQALGRRAAAEAQLGYTRITSPIAGTVTDRPMFAGETPAPGAPVITVMDLTQVIARAHLSPSDAAALKVGGSARIIGADAVPVEATIVQISPVLDAASTTVEVWVRAANPEERLKPGASVRVELIARSVASTLVIPETAVITSSSGATSVIVVDPENRPHRQTVTVGIRDLGQVQITDGLQSGQRVATAGAFELARLDPEVLAKTKVEIQAPKEEEEDDAP